MPVEWMHDSEFVCARQLCGRPHLLRDAGQDVPKPATQDAFQNLRYCLHPGTRRLRSTRAMPASSVAIAASHELQAAANVRMSAGFSRSLTPPVKLRGRRTSKRSQAMLRPSRPVQSQQNNRTHRAPPHRTDCRQLGHASRVTNLWSPDCNVNRTTPDSKPATHRQRSAAR